MQADANLMYFLMEICLKDNLVQCNPCKSLRVFQVLRGLQI